MGKPTESWRGALRDAAEALAPASDPWWIIGSAAVALHGADAGTIADIDVIVSQRDLEALYEHLPLTNTPDATKDFFRSQLFGLWREPALPVEFMAGLEVRIDDVWHNVEPCTRQAIELGENPLFVPEREELVAILRRFGREKDLRRAAALAGD